MVARQLLLVWLSGMRPFVTREWPKPYPYSGYVNPCTPLRVRRLPCAKSDDAVYNMVFPPCVGVWWKNLLHKEDEGGN